MKHSLSQLVGLVLAATATFGVSASRSTEKSFEDFMQQENEQLSDFSSTEAAAFAAYVHADSLAYAQFRAEVEEKWDHFIDPEPKLWTEYDADLSSRSTVDFERGEVEVEVVAEAGTAVDEVRADLAAKLKETITSRGTSDDFAGRGDEGALGAPQTISTRPILEGQIAGESGTAITSAAVDGFVAAAAAGPTVKRSEYVAKDGVARVKLSVRIPLVPQHLRKRAERFLPVVREQSNTVGARKGVAPMPIELVMAVMQTESFFNPKARSAVPAFGLMQLVPSSGARDAAQYLGEGNITPSASALYRPPRNIELGVAYLSKLWHAYYRSVSDAACRQYCVIAAYNTGPGNVNRAINAGRAEVPVRKQSSFDTAIERVNREFAGHSEALKAHLLGHLSHQETRDYLSKVSERMGNYAEWGSGG